MNEPASFDLPPAASTIAESHDFMYDLIWWGSMVFLVVITAAAVWFSIRYHRSKGHKPMPTGHNMPLEIGWTFIPILPLIYLFHAGFAGYMEGMIAPENAIEVRVRGAQWQWEFSYPNGATESDTLTVPVDEPVKLVMSSSDVLHSFFVPAFRVKRDVVPGMYTTLWFEATDEGEYQVYCAEYCGAPEGVEGNAGHSAMWAKVNVVSRDEYDTHVKDLAEAGMKPPEECEGTEDPMACWGETLYSDKGCNACHSTDGTALAGPSWQGIWGAQEALAGGESVTVDENYIRESIRQPQAKVVAAFADKGQMPPYPEASVTEPEVDAIIAFIKSLQK